MLDKLFGWGKKKEDQPEPRVQFGRYSDNNKTKAKINRWTEADNLFKEKKYAESLNAFFDYLRDEDTANVVLEPDGDGKKLTLYQGSKVVRGKITADKFVAEVNLASMPEPGVAVMRRLLDLNFSLYYSRYALDGDRLCMRFDSSIATANPNKLYYGLKELATRADKQDDLLVQDFQSLKSIDTDHVEEMPVEAKEIRYKFLQQWIGETLDMIAAVDPEKFSGGISYLLLTLVYRIDFLLVPEGKLLQEIEAINSLYWANDNRSAIEKNRDMIEAFKKVQAKTKEEIAPYFFHSKSTFSIVAPTQYKNIADSIHKANENCVWYRDNNYPGWASKVIEYGMAWAQYSYSLPRALTELYVMMMRVNYPDYFTALGFPNRFIDKNNLPHKDEIEEFLGEVKERWKEKHPKLEFKTEGLQYNSLVNFNLSFTALLETLNFES